MSFSFQNASKLSTALSIKSQHLLRTTEPWINAFPPASFIFSWVPLSFCSLKCTFPQSFLCALSNVYLLSSFVCFLSHLSRAFLNSPGSSMSPCHPLLGLLSSLPAEPHSSSKKSCVLFLCLMHQTVSSLRTSRELACFVRQCIFSI